MEREAVVQPQAPTPFASLLYRRLQRRASRRRTERASSQVAMPRRRAEPASSQVAVLSRRLLPATTSLMTTARIVACLRLGLTLVVRGRRMVVLPNGVAGGLLKMRSFCSLHSRSTNSGPMRPKQGGQRLW